MRGKVAAHFAGPCGIGYIDKTIGQTVVDVKKAPCINTRAQAAGDDTKNNPCIYTRDPVGQWPI
jgi:hypothetical protein